MNTWINLTLFVFFHSSLSQFALGNHADLSPRDLVTPGRVARPLGSPSKTNGYGLSTPDITTLAEQKGWPNMSETELASLQEDWKIKLEADGYENRGLKERLAFLNHYISRRNGNGVTHTSKQEKEDPRQKDLPEDGLSGDSILNKWGLMPLGFTQEKLSSDQKNALRNLAYSNIQDGTFPSKIQRIINKGLFTAKDLENIYRGASKNPNPYESRSYGAKADWIKENFLNSSTDLGESRGTGQRYSQASFRPQTPQTRFWKRKFGSKRNRRF